MSIKIFSGTCINFSPNIIEVEIDISRGMPVFNIVGLPDASVKESKQRVRSAIENSGYKFPLGRITVNLAPADIKKIGSLLDLPIAAGILMASRQVSIPNDIESFILIGELSLSGEIKGVNGVLPIALEALKFDKNNIIISNDNINECRFAKKSNIYPFTELKEVVSFFNNKDMLPYTYSEELQNNVSNDYLDFSDIIGQNTSKRALVIAAAGYHNIILYGSTGSGKSMLSKALPSIMPELSLSEQIEVAKIYSIAGMSNKIDFKRPPFRIVNHSVTKTALAGGGNRRTIHPGEITLANNGILYLDELLEFKRDVLEVLREPLEEGYININRINANIKLASKFILIGAYNLCPCGKRTLSQDSSSGCTCTSNEIRRYMRRMSKAIKDRIDIYNYVPRVKYEEISNDSNLLSSKELKEIVIGARAMQRERLKNTKYTYNSDIIGKDIFELCRISSRINNMLKYYFNSSEPSLRAYGKVIKLSRTIADIKGNKDIKESDLLEALQYRKDINGDVI